MLQCSHNPLAQGNHLRIVDVGSGLCTITEIPGPHYTVYDAGDWQGSDCLDAAHEVVDGVSIDLMIISHRDSDHLGEAAQILTEFETGQIVVTGDARESERWPEMAEAVNRELQSGASLVNFQAAELVLGTSVLQATASTILPQMPLSATSLTASTPIASSGLIGAMTKVWKSGRQVGSQDARTVAVMMISRYCLLKLAWSGWDIGAIVRVVEAIHSFSPFCFRVLKGLSFSNPFPVVRRTRELARL